MTKYFIAGIPGTGKTTLGNYLAKKRNFQHINIEEGDYIHKVNNEKEKFIEALVEDKNDIVITWGFSPYVHYIDFVMKLKHAGYKLIWFDGDREAAFISFENRERNESPETLAQTIEAFKIQVNSIDQFNIVGQINPIQINTFNENHQYKPLDQIIAEIENKNH